MARLTVPEGVKRYRIGSDSEIGPPEPYEHPDGPWVRVEEIIPALCHEPGRPETGWTCGGSRLWQDAGSDPEAPTGGRCPGCRDCRERPTILDCRGAELHVGSQVDDGGPDIGTVTEFRDCDEDGWKVFAEWPDGTRELFLTEPADPKKAWAGDDTLRCDDLTLHARWTGRL